MSRRRRGFWSLTSLYSVHGKWPEANEVIGSRVAEDKRANLAKTTLGKDESRERTGKLKTEVEAEGHAFSSDICNKKQNICSEAWSKAE